MKVIAKLAGGSHLYGLNTPESDYDERYVYLLDNVNDIIGLSKNEFIDHRNPDTDSFGYELRNFLVSLKKTNTQAMELLMVPASSYIEIHPFFQRMQEQILNLIDPVQYFKSLRGYIQNEIRLANGERTGQLGGKRKAALEKYGYSPKNFVQLLRLIYCGTAFFERAYFPVNIMHDNPELGKRLLDIKLHPENYSPDDLNAEVEEKEALLVIAHNNHINDSPYKFNEQVANDLIMEAYYPMLGKLYAEKKGL